MTPATSFVKYQVSHPKKIKNARTWPNPPPHSHRAASAVEAQKKYSTGTDYTLQLMNAGGQVHVYIYVYKNAVIYAQNDDSI